MGVRGLVWELLEALSDASEASTKELCRGEGEVVGRAELRRLGFPGGDASDKDSGEEEQDEGSEAENADADGEEEDEEDSTDESPAAPQEAPPDAVQE